MVCQGCSFSLMNFVLLTANEVALLDFLYEHGVLNKTVNCPKCEKVCKFYKSEFKFMCTNTTTIKNQHKKRVKVRCNFNISGKKNTFFNNTNLSMREICHFVGLWLFSTPKQTVLEYELGWSSKTVVKWTSICRNVCLVIINKNSEKLGGPGKVVEIVEAKFGKQKYNRGQYIEGQWIFGGMERNSNKMFLIMVPNQSQENLLDIIKEWVLPGTIIMSNCWKTYNCLNNEGFLHEKVNHSKSFVNPDSRTHTKHIKRLWNKDGGGKEDHFVFYLAQYYFHRRYPNFQDRFHHFFKYAAEIYPTQIAEDNKI